MKDLQQGKYEISMLFACIFKVFLVDYDFPRVIFYEV